MLFAQGCRRTYDRRMTMAPDNLDNRLVLSNEYGERSFPHEEW